MTIATELEADMETSQTAAGYWESRKDYRYYREVLNMGRKHASGATSVIDVGCRDTRILERFDWIPSKTALDFGQRPVVLGATNLQKDFLDYAPVERFDLVLCLQVLEHLKDPAPFARKLLATARTAIISVPYRWPAGTCPEHPQDPVTAEKLLAWTGRRWQDHVLVVDEGNQQRLVVTLTGL
jgi:hypothetical protein